MSGGLGMVTGLVIGLPLGTAFGVLLWAAVSRRTRDEAEQSAYSQGYVVGYGRARRERGARRPVPHPQLEGDDDTELGRIAQA